MGALPLGLLPFLIVGSVADARLGVVGLASAGYAAVALGILRGLPRAAGGLGAANRVTLVRVLLSLPVAAVALLPVAGSEGLRWWIAGMATLALSLDGVDGWIARRTGTSSPFGARFDMETDAALLMALSLLAWRFDRAGIWVLAIGGMRYAFVGAGVFLHRLRGELPPSFRRKLVCVIQGVALVGTMIPHLPDRGSELLAAGALLALTGSFGVDTLYLMRTPVPGGSTTRPGSIPSGCGRC